MGGVLQFIWHYVDVFEKDVTFLAHPVGVMLLFCYGVIRMDLCPVQCCQIGLYMFIT